MSPSVRSYVVRAGRMTAGQKRALAEHGPRFLVPAGDPLDLEALFGRSAPRIVEVGFGMGEALLEKARAHPEQDYLGIEVYPPGVGSLIARAHACELGNLRILMGDAVDVLGHRLPGRSLNALLVYFPDPWPKRRHHKRRLIRPDFVSAAHARLKPGGRLHLATDWEDYAQHMLRVVEGMAGWRNLAGAGRFAPRPPERPETKFERRGERLGHAVYDLVFERQGE